MTVAATTIPTRAAPPPRSSSAEIEFTTASPSDEPATSAAGSTDAVKPGVTARAPETLAHPGGSRTAQNIASDERGERGDGRSLEQGRTLAARADGVNLDPHLINTLRGTQEQRIHTARWRASPQDARHTPTPDNDPWPAHGGGILLVRTRQGRAVPTEGVVASPSPPSVFGPPERSTRVLTPDAERAVTAPPPAPQDPGARAHPGAGITHANGHTSSTAAPIAAAHPALEQGRASTTSNEAARRPDDDTDAALLAASLMRAHVSATVQDGAQRAEGSGGVGGGGAPGSGGGLGRGGRSRPQGDGDGWLSLDTDDPRFMRYFQQVRRRLDRLWERGLFPQEEALRLNQGTVIVGFVIERDGSVRDISVQRASGVPAFDRNVREAMDTVHFPPIPAALERESLRVRAPFVLRNPIVR